MSKNEATTVVAKVSSGIVDEEPKAQHRGFQSKEAAIAAAPRPDDDDENDEPTTAEVSDHSVPHHRQVARPSEDLNRMVRVRSREYIAPFRYGPKTYSLPKGKDMLIPLCVKMHLEEKNLL